MLPTYSIFVQNGDEHWPRRKVNKRIMSHVEHGDSVSICPCFCTLFVLILWYPGQHLVLKIPRNQLWRRLWTAWHLLWRTSRVTWRLPTNWWRLSWERSTKSRNPSMMWARIRRFSSVTAVFPFLAILLLFLRFVSFKIIFQFSMECSYFFLYIKIGHVILAVFAIFGGSLTFCWL